MTKSDTECNGEKASKATTAFLRAAKIGDLETILDSLRENVVNLECYNANGLTALHLAAKEGHVNVVRELLAHEAPVNATTKKGNTALHIASLAGQVEVARLLLDHGAAVNAQSQNGFTPLYMASQDNHIEIVKLLLTKGANPSLSTEDGFTPLAVALQQGHERVVAQLLEHECRNGKLSLPALHVAAKKDDVKAVLFLLESASHSALDKEESESIEIPLIDQPSANGFTPLHIAANYGHVNTLQILLQRGATVDPLARHEITPLHLACKGGYLTVAQKLVESGANVECKSQDGLTALHFAAKSGHDAVVNYLLSVGASFSAQSKNGLAPLHMAAQGDHVECGQLLILSGANVDNTTVDYLTPLHVAAHCNCLHFCRLLLDKHCDTNARALNGFTPLHIACKKNGLEIVEMLLEHGAYLEAATDSGLTPLHVASFMGHVAIVARLLQPYCANVEATTGRGETPMHLAVRAAHLEVVEKLLEHGAKVNAPARENQTPLHIAARRRHSKLVELLLRHGASCHQVTKDNYTALHIAAKEGSAEVAAILLEQGGANIESTTKNGFTPLHIAAKYAKLSEVRLLLSHGAAINAQGRNGLTALHVATHYGAEEVAHLLLEQKASVNGVAKNGYTPLHIAASKRRLGITKALLQRCHQHHALGCADEGRTVDCNAQSRSGFTPLHLAVHDGCEDIVQLLLLHGVDVNARSKNGLTPLHLAVQQEELGAGNGAMVSLLLEEQFQCDLTCKTRTGYTPLHTAVYFNQVNTVRLLLQRPTVLAVLNAQTSLGSTPLHLVAQQGHSQLVTLLLEAGADPNLKNAQGLTPAHVARVQRHANVFDMLRTVTSGLSGLSAASHWLDVESNKVLAIELEHPDMMGEHHVSDWDEEGVESDGTAMPASPLFARHKAMAVLSGGAMSASDSPHPLATDRFRRGDDVSLEHDLSQMFGQSDIMTSFHSRTYAEAPNASVDWDIPVDNVPIPRKPITSGFLVAFLVDARGGSMRSSRYPGLRILVPSGAASAPTRVTCRLQLAENLSHPPLLNQADGFACRILEMGPRGCRFNTPILVEVPHYASLRQREREVLILRSDTGQKWKEHPLEATEQAVHDSIGSSFDILDSEEELHSRRIVRILTNDFPQYFALVSRIRQESTLIGAQGGVLSSSVVAQVQAVFPENALQKRIRVGLQTHVIHSEVVLKLVGNRVAVSPIVTVEPRRRKFHKPITLTIPLPRLSINANKNQVPTATNLRLLCSITSGNTPAHWEDITGSTPLSRVKDCISFTTTVSARFWLMDCPNASKSSEMADLLHQESSLLPYIAKFVVFGKRFSEEEAELRCFSITDDKVDKTLECQEGFELRAASPEVEVLHGCDCWIEFVSGNLTPLPPQQPSNDPQQLQNRVHFLAFQENRLAIRVRFKDAMMEPCGKLAFMRESISTLVNENLMNTPLVKPLCTLEVRIPFQREESVQSLCLSTAHEMAADGPPAAHNGVLSEEMLFDTAEGISSRPSSECAHATDETHPCNYVTFVPPCETHADVTSYSHEAIAEILPGMKWHD